MSHLATRRNYSAVTAACLMVRREVFEEAGGFEEAIKVAFNDIDFCMKVRNLVIAMFFWRMFYYIIMNH